MCDSQLRVDTNEATGLEPVLVHFHRHQHLRALPEVLAQRSGGLLHGVAVGDTRRGSTAFGALDLAGLPHLSAHTRCRHYGNWRVLGSAG